MFNIFLKLFYSLYRFIFGIGDIERLSSNNITTHKLKPVYNPICFFIVRCNNHNKKIKKDYGYFILCDRIDHIRTIYERFKSIYFNYFKSIPICIGVYCDHPNHSDIDSLFYRLYKKNMKVNSYIFEKYGIIYLHNMDEDEFIIKFRFLYQDNGIMLTSRKKIDNLYNKYLLCKYSIYSRSLTSDRKMNGSTF